MALRFRWNTSVCTATAILHQRAALVVNYRITNQDLGLDSAILSFVDSATLENFSQTGLGSDRLTPKLWLSLTRCMIWGKLNLPTNFPTLDFSFLN